MADAEPEVALVELRVGQQVGNGVDRQHYQIAALALVEQVFAGVAGGEVDDHGRDDVVVRRAILVAATVGVVQHFLVAGDLVNPFGQGVPFAGRDDAGGNPAIGAGVRSEGDDQRGGGAHTGDILTQQHVRQRGMGVGVVGNQRLLQRHVDVLPLAVAEIPVVQRGKDGRGGVLRPWEVGLIVALPHRRAVWLAGNLHEPAGGQGDEVGGLVALPRPGLPERRDRGHNDARIYFAERLVSQAQRFHIAHRVALHHHVGIGHQPPEQFSPSFRLDVQGYGAFVGVVEQEVQAALWPLFVANKRASGAGLVPARRLHAHHVGAVVSQQLAAEHGLRAAQVEHPVRWEETAFFRRLEGHDAAAFLFWYATGRLSGTERLRDCRKQRKRRQVWRPAPDSRFRWLRA